MTPLALDLNDLFLFSQVVQRQGSALLPAAGSAKVTHFAPGQFAGRKTAGALAAA
jgi:hypothetical protein